MKNTFRILFAAFLALTMCVAGFAITLDSAEAADVTETSEAVLAADAFTAVPGLNYFTGTTEPFTFDDAEAAAQIISKMSLSRFSSITVADIPDAADPDGSRGNAMLLHREPVANDWFDFYYTGYTGFDGSRPYRYTMNSYYAFDATPQSAWSAFIYIAKNANGGDIHDGATVAVNKWLTHGFNRAPKAGYKIDMQVCLGEQEGQGKPSEIPLDFYVDNMMLIPYYKVTYMNADGTETVATEYILYDANGKILTEFTPDVSKVSGATGYALEQGGERVGTVKLENKDVVLYAITSNEASFCANGTNVNVTPEESYTIPAPETLGFELSDFRAWTDGTNCYVPGDVVENGTSLVGKTFKALCFEAPMFDETFGDLIVYFDFEGKMTPSYVNASYDSNSNATRTFGNGNSLSGVRAYVEANGNTAAEAYTNAVTATFRFAFTSVKSSVKAQYTSRAKVKLPEGVARSNFGGSLWLRVSAPGDKPYLDRFNGTSVGSADFSKWQTGYSSIVCPSLNSVGVNWSSAGFNSSYLFDDYQVYAWPSNLIVYKDAAGNYVRRTVADDATEYTFPTAEELGIESDNFRRWTDGTNYYEAGETVELSAVQYKLLKPYYQDETLPAVVSFYEGGAMTDNLFGKFKYHEDIIDDGRDVQHVHQWASSWSGTQWMNDARIHFFARFDAAEYNVISIMMKKTSAIWATDSKNKDTTYGASATASNIVIYNYINANHGYVAGSLIVNQSVPVDGKYHNVEIDMITKPNATYPWETLGYGFAMDPNTVNYGGDTYIDYVRVYRDGVYSVTYDTNAPENATVISEVAADTGRGLGTGYLLKDERPEVEGYMFMGWALTPDATAAETIESFDLTDNTTVYAVWAASETKSAPKTTDEVEIKGTGDSNGIRFKSAITPSVKEELDEFGFLVTRDVLLPYADDEKTSRDYSALTFLHKGRGSNTEYFVKGIAYDADGEIDLINSEDDDGNIIYTAVVSGIPMENKNETMVVRTYAKFNINGKEMVVYGDAAATSLYDTALAVKTADGEAYKNNMTYIESILAE